MTPLALSINRLVNVSVNLSPNAAQMQNLSTLLILGASTVIDTVERIRSYTGIAEVAADFGTTAPEYLAALLWFEQAPQPSALSIGRWAQTPTFGELIGGPLSAAQQSMVNWNAYTSGGFVVFEQDLPYAVQVPSLATQTNLNGVASVIQTAIRATDPDFAVDTCTWNANYSRFEFEASGTAGVGSYYGGFLQPSAATGQIRLANNPVANDTLTIHGTAITFVTGTPTGNQVQIGATVSATALNLFNFLKASTDTNLILCSYYRGVSTQQANTIGLMSKATGTTGNAYTLATSNATDIVLSGATLAGGASQIYMNGALGMNSAGVGAYLVPGVSAETAVAAATLFDTNYGQKWYGLTILGASDADHTAVAPYIEASTNKHIYGVSTQEAGVISATSTTDIASALQALTYKRTVVQYSSSNPYSVCSLLGRILTVDYAANNSAITLMYKQEPGIVPENLNVTQVNALEAKNCNVFVAYNNNTAIIEPGVCSSGNYLDEITGTDWLALSIQNAVFNELYTSPTKIPQTDAGNQILTNNIEATCSQAVRNGLLAPGVWTTQGFGALNEGDFLAKGFYVYAPPVAQQNPADRAKRKSVSIQVAAKLAGAIHTVNVLVNVNR